jgi:DNA (cytosine-5)-methyltransferase 1
MHFIERIHNTLVPKPSGDYVVLDLFAGCGGLALGFEAMGFDTIGFEMDADACQTYRQNLRGVCNQAVLTPTTEYPSADVIIGGPPCQPFSVGGHQLGLKDSRDGFPSFISAVEKVNPDLWLFENVRGLLYSNRWYFDEILDRLKALDYIIEFKLLNAVDYGVPQNRERVIVVGHRGEFQFPTKETRTVSVQEALGEFLLQAPPESKFLTSSMDAYVAKYEKASCCKTPRDLHPHKPARTLTCRNLAGATGDMHRIKLPDGRRRRILLREAARLQSFPDSYEFHGSEISRFNQVGNAVPPLLGWHLAASIRNYLASSKRFSASEIAVRNTPDQYSLALH